MLEKMVGVKVELMPRAPKENEMLCDICDGVGWMHDKSAGRISKCLNCYDGIMHLCPDCKQPMRGFCENSECRQKRIDKVEQQRYERAKKVQLKDMQDEKIEMFYSEVYGYNEGYFSEIEALAEYCEDGGIKVPDYVWATNKYTIVMDAGSIIEQACEELYEDAIDHIDGEKELQNFLDAWCAKQSGVESYTVDYNTAILL